jgi:1,2-diacylglycerol-3-alpha-glucose alpha-1,2-glucosyltransferase
MKVLLYTENEKILAKSGLGKAIKHQMNALDAVKVQYTTNPKDEFDIAHINFYGLKSYFIAKKLKKQGKKIVYHAHSTEEDFRNSFIFSNQVSKLFKKWLIKCYSLGDVIITPTEYSKKLLKGYGIKNEIKVISNGIELKKFTRNDELGEKFRKDYKLKKTDKVIIGIGLYIERKGIIDFIELAKKMPEYKFIWFGYSPIIFSGKKVRNAIKNKPDNLILAGYVEQDKICEALNGCDIYIAPTYEETEGITIIESASCKTNMIVRDIPVFNGWLINKKNVYMVKSIDEFKQKIEEIINGEIQSLSEEAYKIAIERKSENIGKKLKETYSEVLEGKNKNENRIIY